MTKSLYRIEYKNGVTSWDDALPLGNGTLGVLLYGKGPILLSVDRIDLWDLRQSLFCDESEMTYRNLIRLTRSGSDADWAERTRIFENTYHKPYPSKITAGRIQLDFGGEREDVTSALDLRTATASLRFGDRGEAEVFVSAEMKCGVARFTGNPAVSLRLPTYLSASEEDGGLAYPPAEICEADGGLYSVQRTYTDFSYGIVTYRKHGEAFDELYFSVASSDGGAPFAEAELARLRGIAERGYDEIKAAHIAHWRRFWRTSSVRTGDRLLDRNYIRSQYLFASCSARDGFPAPLQGVWTADDDKLPPWKGDYHFDLNVQLTYSSYVRSNHLQEGLVYTDYIFAHKQKFEEYAKKTYGVEGLLIPCCAAVDGSSLGGWAQYCYSPTMSIWIAYAFDEYYRYTDDETFLKTRAYPIFSEIGEAVAALLEEKDGRLYLPLSSSPEIFDNRREACLLPNSNFDLALLIYLYRTLADYAARLGTDGEKWKTILSKFDSLALSDDGVLMLDRVLTLGESHRHMSHLMCLYPLALFPYEGNEAIYEKSLAQLETLGTSLWVGFSFTWASELFASAKKAEQAVSYLKMYCDGFVNTNGFHLNGDFKRIGYSRLHYRPFTLEANFSFCDAIHMLMVQDRFGAVELFPAVPASMKKVRFRGLRAIHGLLIDASLENGRVCSLAVRAPHDMETDFVIDGVRRTLSLRRGKNLILKERQEHGKD